MIPDKAIIISSDGGLYRRKVCGLYPLHRNIKVLEKAGVRLIVLKLSENELDFYKARIAPRLKKTGIVISLEQDSLLKGEGYIKMNSVLFTQAHYFENFGEFFEKKGNAFIPRINSMQFCLNEQGDFIKAGKVAAQYIISNTGGFLAQKINKRISIPISLRIAGSGIHPNVLTVINMFVGLGSSLLVFIAAVSYERKIFTPAAEYLFMAAAGILFQMASVFDGVDGEVAKFTFKVSKIGGWLDTISDNLTLILFLVSSSYLHFVHFSNFSGGFVSVFFIILLFTGFVFLIGVMVSFLVKYSSSGSLVAYDREFLQQLPQDDCMVKLIIKLKYFIKKEFFSLLFCIVALSGYLYLLTPFIAITMLASVIIVGITHLRFIGKWEKKRI